MQFHQAVGIGRADVLNLRQRFGRQHRLHLGAQQVGVTCARFPGLLRRAERAVERRRGAALFGRQVGVATAHGQAVCLAHGGAHHDLQIEVEVERHRLQDTRLLGILLPKIGARGPGQVEQLGDHGGDAAKMARPAGAFQR